MQTETILNPNPTEPADDLPADAAITMQPEPDELPMMEHPQHFARLYTICLVYEPTGEVLAHGPKVSLVEAERIHELDPYTFGLVAKVLPLDVEPPDGHEWDENHGTWFEKQADNYRPDPPPREAAPLPEQSDVVELWAFRKGDRPWRYTLSEGEALAAAEAYHEIKAEDKPPAVVRRCRARILPD